MGIDVEKNISCQNDQVGIDPVTLKYPLLVLVIIQVKTIQIVTFMFKLFTKYTGAQVH